MTDWRALSDAYGAADAVGELLERAGSDPDRSERAVWDELWSRLCHQGTVYTASYAALPSLTDLAVRGAPSGYAEPLQLATGIIASVDGPESPDSVRARFADDVRALHRIAVRNLALAGSETEFVYGLQSVLATESTSVWATRLEALADEELGFRCPACREDLVLTLDDEPSVRPFEGGTVDGPGATPADPMRLTGAEARAHGLAIEHGYHDLAARTLFLFGDFTCPNCGRRDRISSGLA